MFVDFLFAFLAARTAIFNSAAKLHHKTDIVFTQKSANQHIFSDSSIGTLYY